MHVLARVNTKGGALDSLTPAATPCCENMQGVHEKPKVRVLVYALTGDTTSFLRKSRLLCFTVSCCGRRGLSARFKFPNRRHPKPPPPSRTARACKSVTNVTVDGIEACFSRPWRVAASGFESGVMRRMESIAAQASVDRIANSRVRRLVRSRDFISRQQLAAKARCFRSTSVWTSFRPSAQVWANSEAGRIASLGIALEDSVNSRSLLSGRRSGRYGTPNCTFVQPGNRVGSMILFRKSFS